MPWTSRFLVGAIGFFLVAGIAAAGILWYGARSISSEHVEITAQGPVTIASGDTVSLLITVRNENPTTIINTNLLVDLPDGTRQAADKTQPFDHYTDTLGDIPPNGEVSRTVNMVLFGGQNQMLTMPVKVEYRTDDSNALFVAEDEYVVTITTSPLALTVSTLAETASGQPFTTTVTVRNNATTPLENVVLEADYPFGFMPGSANPAPVTGSSFAFGTLAPGAQETVTITGTLTGQAADERIFRFVAGTGSGTNIALPYASTDALVRIARPFLSTTLSLNRETSDEILVPSGESVDGLISWQNNLPVPISDAQISIKFSGNAFDPSKVYAQSGFYRSSDQTILFSKDTNNNLAQLLAGDRGTGSFSFTPKSAAQLSGVANPTIMLTVSIAGNRIGQDRVVEQVSSTVTRSVKVGTSVEFSSRVSRSEGSFTNSGPVPPVPDTETTYTVLLSAENSVNSIGGASATMTLPSYVRFTGQVSPTGSVVYDERTRAVTWRVNDLAPGATSEAAFQVAILPSASQSDTSPVLVSEQVFIGTDRFTKQQITETGEQLVTPSRVTE